MMNLISIFKGQDDYFQGFFDIFLFLSQPKQLIGNARFEGFGVDLMDKIAQILNFTIVYKLVDDDKV